MKEKESLTKENAEFLLGLLNTQSIRCDNPDFENTAKQVIECKRKLADVIEAAREGAG